jgi:acetyl-CoA carboxylase biotin carboxylase subunit
MDKIPKNLQRILVACPGEAAAWTASALHASGLESVVLFAEKAADAPWLDDADYATLLPASFQDNTAILSVAMDAGVDAIISGTMPVQDELVQMLNNTGLGWIGPSPKLAAVSEEQWKQAVREAGLEPLPKSPLLDEENGDIWLERLGLPVALKSRKGLEAVAQTEEELHGLAGKIQEDFWLERLIEKGRKTIVPVVGDGRGGAVHLPGIDLGNAQAGINGDIWECPPPGLGEVEAQLLGEAAATLAHQGSWFGVCGVEVVVDPKGRGWFIQVHPSLPEGFFLINVVAGVDLVNTQLMLSTGEKLGWEQEEIRAGRHAIHLTIRALTTGTLEKLSVPEGIQTVQLRGEGGDVEAGEALLGILISAPVRHAALVRAKVVLDAVEIEGVYTNLHTLKERITNRATWTLH